MSFWQKINQNVAQTNLSQNYFFPYRKYPTNMCYLRLNFFNAKSKYLPNWAKISPIWPPCHQAQKTHSPFSLPS
jgi:hypothetical protein